VTYYRARLARIHAQDFAQYARAAAALLVAELGPGEGLVVDLGCGAGDLAPAVTAAGYDYLGIDASPQMVALARELHPGLDFRVGSAFDLPADRPVRAIVAVGEVLNYAMDPRAGTAGLLAWLRACRDALADGGVLLMDVAGPLRADPDPSTRAHAGPGYRLEVTTRTDPARRTLTRTITVHDATGEETEEHVLHLVDPYEVMAGLGSAGFRATALDRYHRDLPFPRGWSGFLARVILES
jgi:SAM-dependent methyltransferase